MLFALAGHPRVVARQQVTGLAMALGGEASESAGSEWESALTPSFDYAAWSTDLHEFMGDGPFVRPLMDRLACLDAAYEELKADNAALQAEVARLKAQLADAGSGPTVACAGGGKGFGGGEATRDAVRRTLDAAGHQQRCQGGGEGRRRGAPRADSPVR